jgi:hypothetical protein
VLGELTAKLRRDVAANTTKIESAFFDRLLAELLDEIDFEAIANGLAGAVFGILPVPAARRFVKTGSPREAK